MAEDYALPGSRRPRFCPACGGQLVEREVAGDTRPRLVCGACGEIFYLNPKVVAATIPVLEGRIVLGRRAIEPRRGAWTFPSGFVELGETVEEAALRETWEEVQARITLKELMAVYSRPGAGVVVIVFAATVIEGPHGPGQETLELGLFSPEAIPWNELAFDSTVRALRTWVERRRAD